MRIRRAGLDDAPRLVGLFEQWGHPASAEEIAGRLGEWERTPHTAVLVAEAEGTLAGVVAVSAMLHLALPGRFARVAGLAVDASFRRRGIGAALVGAAEALAREWGCDRMEIASSRSRAQAPGFYPAIGYEDRCARSAVFTRPL